MVSVIDITLFSCKFKIPLQQSSRFFATKNMDAVILDLFFKTRKLKTFDSSLFVLEKLMLWDYWVLSIKGEKDLVERPPASEFWCNFDFSLISVSSSHLSGFFPYYFELLWCFAIFPFHLSHLLCSGDIGLAVLNQSHPT